MTHRNHHSFIAFATSRIGELKLAGRYGTAGTYRNALNSFTAYIRTVGLEDIPLEGITPAFIERYDSTLYSRGLVRNTVSFYNRTLRAIYSRAVRTFNLRDARPFADVYTGIDKTSNRAASEDDISRIMNADIEGNADLTLARDLFVFSYLCRGMTFVDMAYLKKKDIEGDYIIYKRKKTGCVLKVKLEPGAAGIIRHYSALNAGSIYVFPMLAGTEDWDAHRKYRSSLTSYNANLKILARKAGVEQPLTSYVPRHSWASAAYRSGVPMNVIGESLGHTSERTTRIYVGSINQDRLDDVNHELVGRIKVFYSSAE